MAEVKGKKIKELEEQKSIQLSDDIIIETDPETGEPQDRKDEDRGLVPGPPSHREHLSVHCGNEPGGVSLGGPGPPGGQESAGGDQCI